MSCLALPVDPLLVSSRVYAGAVFFFFFLVLSCTQLIYPNSTRTPFSTFASPSPLPCPTHTRFVHAGPKLVMNVPYNSYSGQKPSDSYGEADAKSKFPLQTYGYVAAKPAASPYSLGTPSPPLTAMSSRIMAGNHAMMPSPLALPPSGQLLQQSHHQQHPQHVLHQHQQHQHPQHLQHAHQDAREMHLEQPGLPHRGQNPSFLRSQLQNVPLQQFHLQQPMQSPQIHYEPHQFEHSQLPHLQQPQQNGEFERYAHHQYTRIRPHNGEDMRASLEYHLPDGAHTGHANHMAANHQMSQLAGHAMPNGLNHSVNHSVQNHPIQQTVPNHSIQNHSIQNHSIPNHPIQNHPIPMPNHSVNSNHALQHGRQFPLQNGQQSLHQPHQAQFQPSHRIQEAGSPGQQSSTIASAPSAPQVITTKLVTEEEGAKRKRGRPKKLILDPSTNQYIDSSHENYKKLNKLLKESMAKASPASEKESIVEKGTSFDLLNDQDVKQLLELKDRRGRPRKFPIELTGVTIKGVRVNGSKARSKSVSSPSPAVEKVKKKRGRPKREGN